MFFVPKRLKSGVNRLISSWVCLGWVGGRSGWHLRSVRIYIFFCGVSKNIYFFLLVGLGRMGVGFGSFLALIRVYMNK